MSVSPSAQVKEVSFKPLRSKLGCRTCKIRRVKCGEEKPQCLRCTSTGRKCDYQNGNSVKYSSAATALPLHSSLSLSPDKGSRERRAFAYYFQHAAESIGGGLDVEFWRIIVPQVCRSESAIWDAMISISSLFECPDPCPDLTSLRRGNQPRYLSQKHQDALDWYSRAVTTVRESIERGGADAFVGLITCVLFICIETLLGGVEEALRLYGQGIHLIHTLRAQSQCGTVAPAKLFLLRETIIPLFVRLGAISLHSVWALASTLVDESGDVFATKQQFTSLKSARDAIVVLATEIPLFESRCEDYLKRSHAWHISEEMMHRQRVLSAELQSWHLAFTKFMEPVLSASEIGTGALLLTYYEMLSVMLTVCVSSSRITTDACFHNFQNIVEQGAVAVNSLAGPDGTLPPFTFEVGVGLPLWFTCLRCREPTVRRTALALLRRTHRLYGLYKRDEGAALAETIMMIEERQAIEMSIAPSTISGQLSILNSTLTASPSPPPSEVDIRTPGLVIPQGARIRPHGVFRPRDGCPPEATEKDIAAWKRNDEQPIMQYSWNEYDQASNMWTRVYGYAPLGP
ncbi:unnamed protein product [Penicillium pancosmium]